MTYKKAIIIGGGFGGLNCAQALKKASVDLLLIDRTNCHVFQPLLYQVATAALSPADISSSIREILSKQKNTTVLMADIVQIDKKNNTVVAYNGEKFVYDYLVISTGTRHSYFNHPEWEAFAPGLKTLNDALKMRERILLSYERAERCDSISHAKRFMRFVIVGGGPTGVELAGSIAEIARQTLVHDFRHIKPEHTKIYLIEGEMQVLPSYPKDLAEKAKEDLEKMGVDVLLGKHVTDVLNNGVKVGDEFIDSANVFWAAGNAASPLIKTLDIPLDKCGRAIVNPDLSIPEYPNVFVIGDAAFLKDNDGNPLPGVAQVAIQEGKFVANIIAKKIPPNNRKPFKYIDKGTLATIGTSKAVAVIGKWHLSGYFAWLIWCFVHVWYLISFANRLAVMSKWMYLYMTKQRPIRLITRPVSDLEDPILK